MGKALAEASPASQAAFEEADDALGESLSRLCFDGPADRLTLTENTQPAILAVSVAAYRWLASRGLTPGVRRRPQSGRVLRQRRGRHVLVRRRASHRASPRPLHAGGGAGRHRRHVGHPWSRSRRGRPGVRRSGAGRRREPGECERRRTSRDCGVARRGGPRRRSRQGPGCQAGRAAAGQRTVSLCADEAGRGRASRPSCARSTSAIRACPIVANVDAELKRDAASAIEALVAQVSSPVRWEAVVRRLASEGVTTYVEVGPGTVLTGLVKKIHPEATDRERRQSRRFRRHRGAAALTHEE